MPLAVATPPRNLVNLNAATVSYADRVVLDSLSLGVSAGDRIGIVGRNGEGKTTLLRLLAGDQPPDSGVVVQATGLASARLGQTDDLRSESTVREELVGGLADHEWAANRTFRSVLAGLLGGVDLRMLPRGLDAPIAQLSGGERRRVALARLLLDDAELLLLDEPTNHLDVDAVDWLATHLVQRRGALVVITHDRWFLDAVCSQTWEVDAAQVNQYEGGYSAYVLARAERERVAAAQNARRNQLIRKELAWLRRGPPARTSKPKFRIEAANALIADEPPPRDSVELLRFASSRLGDKVIDAIDVSVQFDDRPLLNNLTWRFRAGDRLALVGANGTGKSTLIKVLAGELEPTSGSVEYGSTVRLAHLSQHAVEIPGDVRVRESLESVRRSTTTSDGQRLTAGQLCERFGFAGARAGTLVKDLSGGERRRLQLMRLLMDEPNVLLLDEPTNDLDIDTLTALEDLLDSWPGTLVVVSHDRYFVERVCDNVYAIEAGGALRHVPGGIDEYLAGRAADSHEASPADTTATERGPAAAPPRNAVVRAARKEAARLERAISKAQAAESEVHEQMAAAAHDHVRLAELTGQLADLVGQREQLESEWLEAAATLDGE